MNRMISGLTSEQFKIVLKILEDVLSKGSVSVDVFAFGSRVKGGYRPNSDLDLWLKSKEKFPRRILSELRERFEESHLPFKVDLLESSHLNETITKSIESNPKVRLYP